MAVPPYWGGGGWVKEAREGRGEKGEEGEEERKEKRREKGGKQEEICFDMGLFPPRSSRPKAVPPLSFPHLKTK